MANRDEFRFSSGAAESGVDNNQKREAVMQNPEPIEFRFGARVHALRIERRLPQDALASRAQVHRNYISEMERGKRNVSLRIIERIAKALDVEIAELFQGTEYK